MNIRDEQLFGIVKTHLLSQKVRACEEDEYGCSYRGANDTMCAVGCLIEEDFYSHRMEGYNVDERIVKVAVTGSLIAKGLYTDEVYIPYAMLKDLQSVHDSVVESEWSVALEDMGKLYFNESGMYLGGFKANKYTEREELSLT